MSSIRNPVIKTRNGQLRGCIDCSIEGLNYYSFKGIPYAKPPVGDLRFKDSVPVENWSGIKDARQFGNVAPQINLLTKKYAGNEDCLYLNVYVRTLDVDVKKPVMFWIHGGGFLYFSGGDSHYGPDYLIRKDIVLVTFNYRLGILGFLNLDHEISPGNQGLKDQVLALKWVHANIENFGGDPNNITVFGESAGATAVQYLVTTPLTKGLVNKVILQSGSILNPWAEIRDPKLYVSQLCNNLGKNIHDPKEIFEFLKTIDPEKLINAQDETRILYDKLKGGMLFKPSVDDKSPNPIIPIPSEEAGLEAINLPLLIGYNNLDGMSYFVEPTTFRPLKKEVYDAAEKNLSTVFTTETQELIKKYNLTLEDVKKMYFNDKKISMSTRQEMGDMLSELRFFEGIHKTMKIQVEKSSFPTYGYRFCYNQPITLTKLNIQFKCSGATHFDDVEFLFCGKIRTDLMLQHWKKGSQDYRIMEQLTEMWTNFAKYGNPTPSTSELLPVKWLPLDDGTNLRLLNIDKTIKMETVENIEKKFLAAK